MRPNVDINYDIHVSDDRGNQVEIHDPDDFILWCIGRTGIEIDIRKSAPPTPQTNRA